MPTNQQTKKLKHYLHSLKEKFENNQPPKSVNDMEFFLKMKKETAPIYDLLEKWEDTTLHLIKKRKLNVHPHQIKSTKENMELLILHSYYVDARRRRYMELNHSCIYIFDQLLHELPKNND